MEAGIIKEEKISIVSEEVLTDGDYVARVDSFKLEHNKEVTYKGQKHKRDVLKIGFRLENGIIRYKDVFFTLSRESEFDKFTRAVKGQKVDSIDDLVGEYKDKPLIVEIKVNTKDDKVYHNIVGFKKYESKTQKSLNQVADMEIESMFD